ncbi:MAG: hypothetical protein A2Y33_15015 [Spirochaetes bacterium GWF1_51_8]|nr:MAG: hypothetical protein A2Y33_15015 [Spirochaetes bacterium GWF1_51_8]
MRFIPIICLSLLSLISCGGKKSIAGYDEIVLAGYTFKTVDGRFEKQSYKQTVLTNAPYLYDEAFEVTGFVWRDDSGGDVFTPLIERSILYGQTVEFEAAGYDGFQFRGFAFSTATNTLALKYGESGVYGGDMLFLKATLYLNHAAEPEEFKPVDAVEVGVDLPMRDCDGEWSPFFVAKMKVMDIEFIKEIVRAEMKRQYTGKLPANVKGKMFFVTVPVQSIKDGFFNYHVKVKVKFE